MGHLKSITEIVNVLVQAHKEGKDVNLSKVKQDICARNHISTQPKTVDIINAIPEALKKELLPKIKSKPVRTASGVSYSLSTNEIMIKSENMLRDLKN